MGSNSSISICGRRERPLASGAVSAMFPACMAKGFDLAKLNAPQREAASTLSGPVLILAGAGTGKTRTITARIANMVSKGIRPESILAVTFTNKAANEMKERVSGMVPRGAAGKLTLCTFHSLCVRFLRRGIERLGYKKNFSIYTTKEQTGLIRRILVKRGGRDVKVEPAGVISAISWHKNMGETFMDEEDDFTRMIWQEYEQEKRALNAVDFDDLLVLACKLLKEHSEHASYWGDRFRHIMVDEFQDTNRLQMDLLRRIVGTEQNVCVVGDDDQSIYGWRGADITNILDFERFFPNPKVVKLEENYRSTTPILHTANSLIVNNKGRREKRLWSRNEGDEKVRVLGLKDEVAEARIVIEEIESQRFGERRSWEDFAVLFRTNRQSRLFEEQLRDRRIPYRMIGGPSFYDRREIKDVLAYMAALVNPDDDVQLLRILNTPPRGLSPATAEAALGLSRERGTSVWEILRHGQLEGAVSARAVAAGIAFVEMIESYKARLGEGAAVIVREMLEAVEFVEFVRRSCKTPEEANAREEGIWSVVDDLRRQEEKQKDNALQSYLDSVALNGDRDDRKDGLEKKEGVSLITLHAAKGLEFPVVYLVGVEEGYIPHKRSFEEDRLDEERRLFYVGITRAMQRLTLTFAYMRRKWGKEVPCNPSPFFEELDPEHCVEVNPGELKSQPMTPEEAEAEVDYLRSLLEDIQGHEIR